MDKSRAVFLISDDIRCVMASYEVDHHGKPTSENEFKTLDPDIKIGDFVVVETDTRWKMTVCRVEKIDVDPDLDSNEPMRWVVDTVDRRAFNQASKQESDAMTAINQAERRKRRKELREAMALNDEAIKSLPLYTTKE